MLTCPHHGAPIAKRCLLKKCDLWVKNHHTRCAIAAIQSKLEVRENDTNSAIASLLGLTKNRVIQRTTEAYDMLRVLILRQRVPVEFFRVRRNTRCAVCGKRATIKENSWGWCSVECYRWLPPAAIELEREWNTTLGNLLHMWRKVRVKSLTKLTGLDYASLRWLIWQHTGWCKNPTPKQWLTRKENLVPSPTIPSKKRLLQRVTKSETWRR